MSQEMDKASTGQNKTQVPQPIHSNLLIFIDTIEPPLKVTVPARPKSPVDPIEEMVYELTDSTIVFPAGGWENDLPERLKDELALHRLAHVKLCMDGKEDWEMACDIESLIYLNPASLAAPMGEQWSRIYLYLGTRCLGSSFPEYIKRETLDQYDMSQLGGLRRWIRKKKLEARKLKKRGDKIKAVQDCKYEQLAMDV